MQQIGPVISSYGIENHGIIGASIVRWNYTTPALYEHAIRANEAAAQLVELLESGSPSLSSHLLCNADTPQGDCAGCLVNSNDLPRIWAMSPSGTFAVCGK